VHADAESIFPCRTMVFAEKLLTGYLAVVLLELGGALKP